MTKHSLRQNVTIFASTDSLGLILTHLEKLTKFNFKHLAQPWYQWQVASIQPIFPSKKNCLLGSMVLPLLKLPSGLLPWQAPLDNLRENWMRHDMPMTILTPLKIIELWFRAYLQSPPWWHNEHGILYVLPFIFRWLYLWIFFGSISFRIWNLLSELWKFQGLLMILSSLKI